MKNKIVYSFFKSDKREAILVKIKTR